MKKIIIVLLINTALGFSQVSKQWEHSYQYFTMNWGNGVDLIVNNLNEPVVLGQQWGWEQTPILHIYKLNSQTGTVIWDRTPLQNSMGQFIFSDSANNIYVCGQIKSGFTWTVPYLTKYNNSGTQIFYKTDPADLNGPLFSACTDGNGSCMLLSKYLYWVKTTKYDPSGNILWHNFYSRADTFTPGKNIYFPTNKTTIVNGNFTFNNRNNIFVSKIDSGGNTVLSKDIILRSLIQVTIFDMKPSGLSDLIMTGEYMDSLNQFTSFIYKLNSSLDTVWSKKNVNNLDYYWSNINIQNDGSLVTNKNSGITKLDASGNILWSTNTGNYSKIITGIDGFIYACGKSTNNKFLTTKFDQSGNTIWEVIENTSFSYNYFLSSLKLDTSYNVYVHGTASSSPFSMIATIKYSQLTSINSNNGLLPLKQELLQNYPNPFNPATNLRFNLNKSTNAELLIYDIKGSLLTEIKFNNLDPGEYTYNWNAGNYPSGIYFVKLLTEFGTQTRKVILIK